jgi:DNA-binding MarR family transcriptional regulator
MFSPRTPVDIIGDALHRLIRGANRRKAQLAADGQDAEWAAHALLEQILSTGPLRAAGLAECTFTDPSTVSRHVASLVRDGLVERKADPVDGRASLLVATAAGEHVVEEHRQRRLAWLEEMLAGWTPQDRDDLGRLLEKFTLDLESLSPVITPASEGTR